jgi:NADH-quinone oxidoreductase subunit N
VNFQSIFNNLLRNTTDVSLPAFRPELVLCGTIVLMLLVRVFNLGRREDAFFIALLGSALALYFSAPWIHLEQGSIVASQELFTGLLVYDPLAVYFRALLLFFAVLFVVFTRISGIPDREDGPDFYTLVLGGTLGMCLMTTANHLVMVFLAVEMASVPSYALAGMLKGRRQSSEAALKYAVYGAGAAGVMLYGISLLAGVLGSAHLPTMAVQLADVVRSGADSDRYLVLSLGALMVGVGLAFKLSVVPFHFWCPDVFEGASAEVNAFLSVASKAGALALLVRVVLGLSYVDASQAQFSQADQPAAVVPELHAASDAPAANAVTAAQSANAALEPVRGFLVALIALLASITCTLGNLAAYGQNNIKRLLAYSTIAHAGYMIMPVAAALALAGTRPDDAQRAISALCFYAGVYLFMNLGAFAIVAFLRNELRSEELPDYAGLIQRSPGAVICLSLIMLSLLGVPPLAGLWAKVYIFAAMIDAARLIPAMWVLIAVAGLNAVLSLFYYLRVVKVMVLDPPPADAPENGLPLASAAGLYTLAVTLPVLILGIWWNGLNEWAVAAASRLLS